MKIFSCFFVVLSSLIFSTTAADLHIYVAPNGNDSWSGQDATPAVNAPDGPLATLDAALAKSRAWRKANDQAATVTIDLRGGVYELAAPIELSALDSKTTIKAFRDEKPIISGGRRLRQWSRVEGKQGQWQTTVPEVAQGHWHFRQLFVDGKRQQRARTPNEGFFRIQGASPQDKPVRIHYKPGDIKPEWAKDGDVEVIAMLAWADIRMQIREVDETSHVAVLSGEPRPSNRENDARYFIENAPDGLDQPGEWYLDRKTGVVTLWAGDGVDPNKSTVTAPRLQDLVVIRGDEANKKPVEALTFRGLTFAYTDWELGPKGYADTQAAIATHGDLLAEWAVDCAIEDCQFEHLAGYAIELGRGCKRDRVVGNVIHDIGGGGVRVGEPAIRPDSFDGNSGHIITDNEMAQLGRIYSPAVGVFVLQSGGNKIAHNNIHDLYYTAVSVGWNWGYRETPCRDNIVEFNHLHHIGQEMLSDMGAVYTLGIQKGTVIRNNLIHDVRSFTYGGWGLYPDEGSTSIVWENNVVYNTKSAGFHQHYGRENIVRNNIFAFGQEHQLMRTRAEPHISFIFTNNIVYFDSGSLLGSNWSSNRFEMERNVYFDARPGATPDSIRFGKLTFEQWQKEGRDLHSIVADPLFVNAREHDFKLKPESPALKLGFKQIDLSAVGVRPRGQRN